MNAQQTFIIEAGRRNSLEYKSGTGVSNSKWTNVVNPILLKRGDYVSVDTAIINQKGAEASNNIEMSGQESYLGSNIQQNFSLLEFGFYLNRTGINDVGLPYRFVNELGGDTHTEYNTTKYHTNDDGDITSINNNYGMPIYSKFLREKDSGTSSTHVSFLTRVKSHNPYLFLDSKRYAKVNPNYYWGRHDINPTTGKSGLFTETVPIFVDKGFQNASQIGEKITQQLQFSNDPSNQVEDLYIPKIQYYKDDTELTGINNPIITQQVFSGKLNKVFQANNQPITGNYSNDNSLLGHLYCDNPTKFEWGSKLLTETELVDLTNNARIRNKGTPNPFDYKDVISFDYPVLLWSTYNGSLEKSADNQERNQINAFYEFYSPSYTFLDTNENGTNGFYFKNFTGNMSNYNDWYIETKLSTSTDALLKVAVYLTDPNQFYLWTMPNNPTNGNLIYNPRFYLDTDDINNDQMIIYNLFSNLDGTWTADLENVVVWDIDNFLFVNGGTVFRFDTTKDYFIEIDNQIEGVNQYQGVYNFLGEDYNDNILKDGQTYTISFSTQKTAGTGNYNNFYLRVKNVNVLQITGDGNHTYSFTQTGGDYVGGNAVMLYYYHSIDPDDVETIEISDFLIEQTTLNKEDEYQVKNIFENTGENDKLKMYEISILDDNIKNTKLDFENSTIIGGNGNGRYTPIGKFTVYFNGSLLTLSTTTTQYTDAVLLQYYDGDNDKTYYIGNFRNLTYWAVFEIDGQLQNEDLQNASVLGTVVQWTYMKNPKYTGQQYYNFQSGNPFNETTDFINFEIGNVWNTTNGGGGNPYTCSNEIFEGLQRSYTWYNFSDGNNYTGGTPAYTYSFVDGEGQTGSYHYNSILTIDTNGGNPATYTIYLQTTDNEGLSGTFLFNGSSAGNSWTLTTTGGQNGFGTISFTGAITLTIHPSSALTTNTRNFDYDYHFNGFHDIYVKTDTTGDHKNGTYLLTLNAETQISQGGSGTWSYDDTTGQISFTANDTAFNFTLYYQTTNPSNTKYLDPISITNQDTTNPSQIPNSSKYYYYSFPRRGNTYYMTLEGDTDLTGRQGKVYENDTTIFGDWTYNNSTAVLTFTINAETFSIDGNGSGYLLQIFYDTFQNITVGGITYQYPTDQDNINIPSYGETSIINDKHFPIPDNILPNSANTLYLNFDFINNFDPSTYSMKGRAYSTIAENNENNAVAEWTYTQTSTKGLLKFYEVGDESEIYLQVEKDVNTILDRGWILTKTEKYADIREITQDGNYLGITEKFYMTKNFGSTGGENNRNIPQSVDFPEFKDYTINGQDVSGSFVDNAGLNNTYANLEEHEFLLTNMKMSLTNLKILKGFMKDNEIYDGDLTGRNDIMKDDENFYCHFDIGRTDEHQLDYDNNEHENIDDYNAQYPLFQEYMRDHGKLTKDDGDDSNTNIGNVCPRMKGQTEEEQRFKVYTRYNENWSSILKYERRLTDFRGENGVNPYIPTYLYGAVATEEDFKREKPEEYAFVKENNIAVYPYWISKYTAIGFSYELAIGLDLYAPSNNTNGRYFKVQDLTYFGFSPSLLDHNYIIGMNPDVPALPGGVEPVNYNWSNFENDNCNFINVGSPQISIDYDPDKNKFIWNYLYNPMRFNSKNGVDADLEQEVCFLNDTQNARFYDNIRRENQFTEMGSTDISGQQNLGILDAQCGVFLKDFYGQSPRETGFITDKNDGTLMTNLNYENCLWWKMGFSYFDLKPIKYSENSFNNRFNGLTYNNTYSEYRKFSLSPFTNNSNLTIEDTGKINIFGANRTDPNDAGQAPGTPTPYIEPNALYGQPAFYLGFNNSQPVSIKVGSNPMISRSVIVNIASSFLRIMTNIPLDTLSYNTDGSLSCAGYMTKNYLSSSFVYSFSTGFGGYLTRDMYLTSIETSLRNDVGLLVDNIDEFSTIFYKVVRNITLSNPSGGGDSETKENELLEDIKDELEENNETLEDIKEGEGLPVDVRDERGGQGNSQRISRGKLLKAVNKLGKSLPQGSKAESAVNRFRQSIIKDLPKFITKNLSFIASYLSKYKGEEEEVDFLLNDIKKNLTKLKDPQNLADPDIYLSLRNSLSSINGILVDGDAGNEKELGEILMSIKDQFIFMNDDDEVQEQIRQLEENQQLISIKPKMREDFNDIYTEDIGRERIGEIGESLLQYDPASFEEFRKRVSDKTISDEDLKDTLNKYINGIGFVNELREPSPNETLTKEEKDKIKFNIRATQFVAQSIYLSIQSILRNSGGSVLRAVRNLNKGDFVSKKVFEKMTDAILSFVREKQKSTKEFIESMADKYAGVSFNKFKKSPEATEFIREFTKTGAGTRGFLINSEGDLVKRTAGNKRESVKLGEEFLKGRSVRFTKIREDYLNKIVDEITTMAIDEDTTPKSFNIDVRNILTPLVDKSKTKEIKEQIKNIEKRRRGRPKGTTKAVMEERRRKALEEAGGAGKDEEETKPERSQEPEEKTAEPEEKKKTVRIKIIRKRKEPVFKSTVLTKQEREKAERQSRMQEIEEDKKADKKGGGKPAQQEK